jgi:hypothetical protein
MFRRRRPLARAAMVGGAAYYAGKHVQQGRSADEERDARLDELEAQQPQQAYAPPPAPSGGTSGDAIAQLERLGQLRDAGVLTDAELQVQKEKILQGGLL